MLNPIWSLWPLLKKDNWKDNKNSNNNKVLPRLQLRLPLHNPQLKPSLQQNPYLQTASFPKTVEPTWSASIVSKAQILKSTHSSGKACKQSRTLWNNKALTLRIYNLDLSSIQFRVESLSLFSKLLFKVRILPSSLMEKSVKLKQLKSIQLSARLKPPNKVQAPPVLLEDRSIADKPLPLLSHLKPHQAKPLQPNPLKAHLHPPLVVKIQLCQVNPVLLSANYSKTVPFQWIPELTWSDSLKLQVKILTFIPSCLKEWEM